MANDPTDWHQALAHVNGHFVRGQQRVTTYELLTVKLGVPQVRRPDVMERIIAMLAEERAKEKELLERGASEGPAAARPSTCPEDPGIDILPAQETNDRA